jgi:hypothetical protein
MTASVPRRVLARRCVVLAASLCLASLPAAAQLTRLGTSPGDGSVQFEVDAYGSFGYHASGAGPNGRGDSIYDPVGAVGPSSTTWESAVYFRQPPGSAFLTTGLVGEGVRSGQLPDPGFLSSDGTTAVSAFTHAGLEWQLTQTVQDLVVGAQRVGTLLLQEHVIRNPGPASVAFDLVRYYEGDLFLGAGAGVPDGGGHMFIGMEELVFETDLAGEPASSTNLVGITACGGSLPAVGRYEVNQWPAFPQRMTADQPLGDVVFRDGVDPDEFVDGGLDYDVGIALANQFALFPGEVVLYVTTTAFGSLPPEDVTGGCSLARRPVASAGPDLTACPGEVVTLDGSGSFDPDAQDGGGTPSWSWDLDGNVDTDGNGVRDDDRDATGETVTASFPPGDTTVTLTYTDDDGETATNVMTVHAEDLEPPRLDCPAEVAASTTSFTGGPATVTVRVSDDCDPAPAVTNDRTAGGADASDEYPCGVTLVTFLARDASGKESTCAVLVRITPDVSAWTVGPALRVSKLADTRPVLDWSRAATPPPEARYTVLRDDTRRPPGAAAPGADRLDTTTWTETTTAGALVFYDVRTVLCDGSLSDD